MDRWFLDPKKWENFEWAPKVSPKDVDLVIASYNENLWYIDCFENLGYKVIVYNVNKFDIFSFTPCPVTLEPANIKPVKVRKIQNYSQEASQWLYHLSQERGNLNKFNVFLQGDLGYNLTVPLIEGVGPDRVMEILYFLNSFSPFQNWLNVPVAETSIERVSPDLRERFAPFFEPLSTPSIVPRYLGPSVSGGQFLVSKVNLLRIPENHFKKLYEYTTNNHRAAWDFEYHWGILLDAYGCVWEYPKELEPKES